MNAPMTDMTKARNSPITMMLTGRPTNTNHQNPVLIPADAVTKTPVTSFLGVSFSGRFLLRVDSLENLFR